MSFPNDLGPRPNRGGAPIPGTGGMPSPPNKTGAAGDKRNEDGKQSGSPGGFPPIPNQNAPMPGHGGKM